MRQVQSLKNLNLLNYVDPDTNTHHSIKVEVLLTNSNVLKVKPVDPKLQGISVDIQLDEAQKSYTGEFVCKFSMNYSDSKSLDVAEFGQAIISHVSGEPTIQSQNKTFSLKKV